MYKSWDCMCCLTKMSQLLQYCTVLFIRPLWQALQFGLRQTCWTANISNGHGVLTSLLHKWIYIFHIVSLTKHDLGIHRRPSWLQLSLPSKIQLPRFNMSSIRYALPGSIITQPFYSRGRPVINLSISLATYTLVPYLQWNLSIKGTLNKGHFSNEDTVCSPNDIELCKSTFELGTPLYTSTTSLVSVVSFFHGTFTITISLVC